MFRELGISAGTAIIILIVLYFIIKWAVKNGIKEAYKDLRHEKLVKEARKDNNESEVYLFVCLKGDMLNVSIVTNKIMEKYLCNNIFDSNNFYPDRYIYHSR